MRLGFIGIGLAIGLAVSLVSVSGAQTPVFGGDAFEMKGADAMAKVDALIALALLSTDREKLIGNLASEPASLQRDCGLLDLQLRSGHRESAARLLDQLIARPDFAPSGISSGLISFMANRNQFQGLKDAGLAAKLYRKFPDPNLPELRDIVVYLGRTEGDIEVIKLLRPLPYTERVAMAVGSWREGLEKRGKVEDAMQMFQAAGRIDLAKAVRGEQVATVGQSAGASMPQQTQNLMIAQVQGHAPPPPTDPNTAEYWLEKARAANEQHDVRATESALARALELAPVEAGKVFSKGGTIRESVLDEYRRFLIRQNRPDEAVFMLRKEVAGPGLNTVSGRHAFRTLEIWSHLYTGSASAPGEDSMWQELRKNCEWSEYADELIIPGDESMWQALKQSDKWGSEERQCLEQLAGRSIKYPPSKVGKNARQAEAYGALERAEKMCEGADVSRKLAVAELWRSYDRHERAVPLLQQALPQITDESEAAGARKSLFRNYLATNRQEEAEAIALEIMRREPRNATIYLGDLARAWAKKGDKTRAMEDWRKASNIDAAQLHPLRALSEAGLKPDLVKFYLEWQQTDSESWVPPMALQLLEVDLKTWSKMVYAN